MSDDNYLSVANETGVRMEGVTIDADVSSPDYDDILKVSNVQDAEFAYCVVNLTGGNREDGVDVMRYSHDVRFYGCRVGAGQKYAFTIKGGSDQIEIRDSLIIRPGGGWERVDIDIGNYSSTVPDARTGMVILRNVQRLDGKPLRVRVGWADRPLILQDPSTVHVLFWQSLALKVYVWFRRHFWP